jgi:pimeloyl-ACP methyl ester carboxylesterase/DNA-binding CsgD family transcriptional regulator
MEHDIRFCTTADGVRLAVGISGKGPPIVKAATWLTHLEYDLTSPFAKHWLEAFSRDHTFVGYDARGCGLSDRRVGELSMDAWLEDLDAVVDLLRLERFPLLGISQGAAIAVAYAARHPQKVSRLVLLGGFARAYFSAHNPDPKVLEEGETLIRAAKMGWGRDDSAFRQVFVTKFLGDATAEQQRAFDERQRVTTEPEMAVRYLRAMFSVDVKEIARQVACPTLVFHCRNDRLIYFDQGRKLAAQIPGARFIPLESANHIPFENEPAWTQFLAEVRPFLAADGNTAFAGASSATNLEQSRALTPRQIEILREVAHGQTDKQIARKLSLSPRTVEMHVANALAGLQCRTRAEAVRKAGEQGLLG